MKSQPEGSQLPARRRGLTRNQTNQHLGVGLFLKSEKIHFSGVSPPVCAIYYGGPNRLLWDLYLPDDFVYVFLTNLIP